jgi:hypothetical protein
MSGFSLVEMVDERTSNGKSSFTFCESPIRERLDDQVVAGDGIRVMLQSCPALSVMQFRSMQLHPRLNLPKGDERKLTPLWHSSILKEIAIHAH